MFELLGLIAGAIAGTVLRLTLDTIVPHTDATFPLSTLVINLLGSLVLGFFVARLWPRANAWQKAALGPGLLGTFTTFSAFAVSLVTLATAGEWALAIVYLVVTLVGGGLAAFGGLALGGRVGARAELGDE
ncbi:MAG TPA: CrcB family protein [Kofleriaceae bacterium]